MDLIEFHERTRTKGVNVFLYWPIRLFVRAFMFIYWRQKLIGRSGVPRSGPVIFASNHRSFLDPFAVAALSHKPTYFVAKKELFAKRWQGKLLNMLGAFPVDRGHSDEQMLKTARLLLERGESVVIFPEGTRVRPGPLGNPHRGVGRLALETGAAVVPVAVMGTENIRTGWRIRPHKIRVRAGRSILFPRIQDPSPQLATAAVARIWPCVMLLWEWLGGEPPSGRQEVRHFRPSKRAAKVARRPKALVSG